MKILVDIDEDIAEVPENNIKATPVETERLRSVYEKPHPKQHQGTESRNNQQLLLGRVKFNPFIVKRSKREG